MPCFEKQAQTKLVQYQNNLKLDEAFSGLCGISICKPLEIILQNCLRLAKLPSEWKKANVIPAYKKGEKQCIKNYCPVSLLLDCSKEFEWLLYNNTFPENNLISPKQSGFRPGDSLLSIAHKGVSFRIYLKHLIVWHEGLLFKLQQNKISGQLITLIKDFFES